MVGQTSKLGNSSAAVGPRRMLLKSGKAGITALVVAFVAALAMGAPTAALAQSFPAAVTNIKINSGSTTTPIHVYEYFDVTADWAVPDTAVPGDTFELAVNAPIQMLSLPEPVELKDADGNVVGTCTVTSTVMKCTLSDYVLTHDNVHGSLYFKASATKEVTGPVVFVVGGVQIPVAVPGGTIKIIGAGPAPTSPYKLGWQDLSGTLTWRIVIPGQALQTTGADLVFTDKYQAGLKLTQPHWFSAVRVLASNWNEMELDANREYLDQGTAANTYSVLNVNDAANSFDFRFNAPDTTGKYVYILHYRMVIPPNTAPGTKFSNEVVLGTKAIGAGVATTISAGGTGTGDSPRSIKLSKAVDGAGTAPDVSFDFSIACVDAQGAAVAGFPQTAAIKASAFATVATIPIGSVCTILETNSYGAAKVTFTPSNVVTVTKDSPALIEVTATNTYNSTPTGGFSVTKSVAGSGASTLPAGTDFTVSYSYPAAAGGAPITGTLVMKNGGVGSLDKLPTGTKVTLSEITPTVVAGADWAAPVFTVGGVRSTNAVTITIGDNTTVGVGLTNTLTTTPATPVVVSVPPVPTAPTVPTVANGPAIPGGLALTGSEAGPILPLSAAMLLAFGGVLLFFRRKKTLS